MLQMSLYLKQYCPSLLTHICVPRPQWINVFSRKRLCYSTPLLFQLQRQFIQKKNSFVIQKHLRNILVTKTASMENTSTQCIHKKRVESSYINLIKAIWDVKISTNWIFGSNIWIFQNISTSLLQYRYRHSTPHVLEFMVDKYSRNAVECRYNAIHYIVVSYTVFSRLVQNLITGWTKKRHPYLALTGDLSGIFCFVRIWEKINHVITVPHGMSKTD